MRRLLVGFTVVLFCTSSPHSGCFEGGATFNAKAPGNNDSGGIDLSGQGDPNKGGSDGRKDVAVDPHGVYMLASLGQTLVMGELVSGKMHSMPDVGAPSRVAFATKANRFYVTSAAGDPRWVYGVDSKTRKVIWKRGLSGFTGMVGLYPSMDDAFLVLADQHRLEIVDAADGTFTTTYAPEHQIADLDITPDSKKVVVTEEHTISGGEERTAIFLLNPDGEEVKKISVPNCSSPLVLSKDGARAFLAPTQCGQDPVSAIDLVKGEFIKNLPGFGPVAMAPDGTAAVAFMDTVAMDKTLFEDKSQIPSTSKRYHMMVIDPATLKFSSIALGDNLPRYAISRDGKVVLVDSVWMGLKEQVRLVDLKSGAVRPVSAEVYLDHFVLSPNNTDVYLLSEDLLRHLDLKKAEVRPVSLGSVRCQSLNITLTGDTLLIMDWQDQVHLLNTRTEKVSRTLSLK